jgi:quercetin dioxygenase-like cupin family protein
MQKQLFNMLSGILIPLTAHAQQAVSRKDLLTVTVNSRMFNTVQAKEITMTAGQHAPRHQHPCPVVGYIAEGTLIYQIQGQSARILAKGEAFYEPPGTVIVRFDNGSAGKPLKFVAFYLGQGEQPLVEILPEIPDK